MIVVVFTHRLRADANLQEYEQFGNDMYLLAQQHPGFISATDYSDENGERVAIECFTTLESLEQWRKHPEHVKMQQLGRERFYESYTAQVCTSIRQYSYNVNSGRTIIE